ncbi:MAG: 5'-methylthioadenosine/S-adenosylhomocysteine nucleosidase [Alphaproteobacteria bacterium]|nr:5'-methylthioadenosine/S-adenosylhomocysteine nucleosidase [Alphaproteobacteria bacterium]
MKNLLKQMGGRQVLFVMAADQEYGAALQSRFKPLITGVGPVEAAVQLAAALGALDADRPDLIVSLGSAGSRDLEQTKIYQVASVSYRDMDASALGFEKGATPFLDMPVTLDMPFRIDGLPAASLSTGANIVSGNSYDDIDADMVDMETFAVMRVCQHYNIPLVGLRGISDGRDELRRIGDWTEYLHVIDENLAEAVDRLDQAIIDGEIMR